MSIWGVNQAIPAPVVVTAGADVSCPAGTETTVLSGTVTVPTPGLNFSVQSDVTCTIVLGATAPTALQIGARVGLASDYDFLGISPSALVANAVLNLAPSLIGIFARNAAVAGSTINITVNPTGQAVTFKLGGRVIHCVSVAADV